MATTSKSCEEGEKLTGGAEAAACSSPSLLAASFCRLEPDSCACRGMQ